MSTLLQLGRRIFTVRNLLRVVFVLIALVTAWTAFCLEERWRGERLWNNYRAAAIARGVKLDMKDVIPPDVPDAENFAAIPLIQNRVDEWEKGRPFTNWFAAMKLNVFRTYLPPGKRGKVKLLDHWRDELIRLGVVPAGRDSAETMLAALELVRPELEQLHEAGLRPKSKFPVQWERGISAGMPYLGELQAICVVYRFGIVANLAKGNSDAAMEYFRDGIRVYKAQVQEPILVTGLVRKACLSVILAAVCDEGSLTMWKDADLKEIIASLTKIDLVGDWRWAIASERALQNDFIDSLFQKSDRELISHLQYLGVFYQSDPALSEMDFNSATGRIAVALYPRGWFRLSQVRLNEEFDTIVQAIDAMKQSGVWKWKDTDSIRPAPSTLGAPFILYRLLGVNGSHKNSLKSIVTLDQTIIACALARYRLKTGEFPEKLDQLVPSILQTVPRDPMDGAPMRYARTDDGGFKLWSVGTNGIDDGGINRFSQGQEPDWVLQVPGKR